MRIRSLAALLAAALAGCAGGYRYPALPAPETLPEGSPLLSESLGRTDAWLRHYLMEGKADSALLLLETAAAPRDDLLRALQRGIVLHYAGRWQESNAAFQWAEDEAERRWSRSVTQAAGTLLLNDAVVSYTPPPPELAMIPYYRMLNYAAEGSRDGALVEARKAGDYLERLRKGAGEPCVGEPFVQYLTGLVYAGAGEDADALVSYRQAERGYEACAGTDGASAPGTLGADLFRAALQAGVREVADSAASRYGLPPLAQGATEAAELVLLVEQGWVAHRASADIHVPIWPEELKGVDGADVDALLRVAARLAANLADQGYWGSAWDEHPVAQAAAALEGAYLLKLAWPVYRLEACAPARVRVVVDGVPGEAVVAGDLSTSLVRRWEARRPAALTRMMARGIVKYLASREAEKKAEKEGGEVAGWVAGRVANLAGNLLERADTRSWSLLPDRISLARFTLPPGEHAVRIEVLGEDDEVIDVIDYGTVALEPRGTLILNRRVWGGEAGDFARLAPPAAPGEAAVAKTAVLP